MKVATLGIDSGKTWFHVVGLDAKGKPLFQKKLRRAKLMEFVGTCQPCPIGKESCHSIGHQYARVPHSCITDCNYISFNHYSQHPAPCNRVLHTL